MTTVVAATTVVAVMTEAWVATRLGPAAAAAAAVMTAVDDASSGPVGGLVGGPGRGPVLPGPRVPAAEWGVVARASETKSGDCEGEKVGRLAVVGPYASASMSGCDWARLEVLLSISVLVPELL